MIESCLFGVTENSNGCFLFLYMYDHETILMDLLYILSDDNKLSGSIPTEIGMLRELTHLFLGKCCTVTYTLY